MRLLSFFIFSFFSLQLTAQDLDFVKAHVEQLTDSFMYGRGYVHHGSNRAAEYVANEFAALGLKPVGDTYFQPFDISLNTFPGRAYVEIDGQALNPGYDFIINPASGSDHGKYSLVHLDSTHFSGSAIPVLRSKEVPCVFLEGIDSPDEVAELHEFKLTQLGEKPVVLVRNGKTTWSVGQRRFAFPEIEIDGRNLDLNFEKMKVAIQAQHMDLEVKNVVAKLEGIRSDTSLVITAHLDHLGMMGPAMFPGASDNASGVATMLDLARHYSENQPEYDIYFIGFAGEEAGLVGSRYFVDHPMFPLETVKLLINVDLMGSAAEGITVVNGKLYPDWMSTLASINKENDYLPKIKLRGKAANSDHYWFSERGVPSVFIYTMGNVKAYHDVHDVASGLDWANYPELFNLMVEFISAL